MSQKKYCLSRSIFCSIDLTYSITIFSGNVAKHFNSEVAKIVATIDKLKANQLKVDICLLILSLLHYFPS